MQKITPADAAKLVAAGKAVLVDVREPAEWAETGVATPAVLLVRLRDVLLSDTSPLKVMAPPVVMLAPRLITPEPTPVLLGLSTKALVPVPFKAELMVMCR